MYLGNVKIVHERKNDSISVAPNDMALETICGLLKVKEDLMRHSLCYKQFKTVTDVFEIPLDLNSVS
jgi:myosin heavy subunit